MDLIPIWTTKVVRRTTGISARDGARSDIYPVWPIIAGELEKIPFDFQELLGALAPRPFFVNAPLGDGNFEWKSVDACAAAARPVYKLLGGKTNLIVKHPDCGHDFPKEMREEAYRVIDSVLRP